jgi:hypothetical protein
MRLYCPASKADIFHRIPAFWQYTGLFVRIDRQWHRRS